jgi:hypothetical protein
MIGVNMLYVALGRNVGDKPMATAVWNNFVANVTQDIEECEGLAMPDTVAYGKSRYGSMLEETCVLVWFDKNSSLRLLTEQVLSTTAIEFGQESIAWSVSVTEFVEGVK